MQKLAIRFWPGLLMLLLPSVCLPACGYNEVIERDEAVNARVVNAVQEASPDLVFVCLGAPKQELWMHTHRDVLAPAVMIGLGATLDFIAGDVQRAPAWMSDAGLEWLYRLAQEPRRLAYRYLVRDRAFIGIALRAWLGRRRDGGTAEEQPAIPGRDRVR